MKREYFLRILFLIILSGLLTACPYRVYYQGQKTSHCTGYYFYNGNPAHYCGFKPYLYWKTHSHRKYWPDHVPNQFIDYPPTRVYGDELRISWVGHATVLIQTQGLNILTDPVWSERIGPPFWAFWKRVSDPGVPFAALPKIDIVLISHDHYDHMDLPTLKALWKRDKPFILTPLGNDNVIKAQLPYVESKALDWWDKETINPEVTIHLVPSQHWCRRWINDRDASLWGGFVIETPSKPIYFAGDTGYVNFEDNFKEIHQRFGTPRLALLPIGAYAPRWYLAQMHMNPNDAVLAHKDLGQPYTMGIHFDTFELGDNGYNEPVNHLALARAKHNIPPDRFRALAIGQSWWIPNN